ncbi:MAG: LysM peptidoglycan-binding domain-containing protein [Anaerolineae bacterium]|nr:LysM peptidoglycan-binding domain-containing protein [Anaerolineae bacterium]
MELETQESGRWQWNLLITFGVVGTVLLALLLAQLDGTPQPMPPSPPVLITDVTIIAPSQTPLPAIPLVSATPTTTPFPTPIPTTTSPLPEECGAVPAGWIPTTVHAGESIMTLAIRSGTSEAAIIRANCLRQDMLLPGLIIYLPPAPPTRQPCGPPTFWTQYVVQSGDTMFSLALRYGTTVYAIINANCLSSSDLRAGQVIFLPPLRITATPTPPPTERPSATPWPPTSTPVPPTNTAVPATDTPIPPTVTPSATATSTATAVPPTSTPSQTPLPPTPTDTATAVPPTDTPTSPPPTDTPTLPPPTDTPTPLPPTDTPPPPTDTPPPPTDTPAPPTDTPTP